MKIRVVYVSLLLVGVCSCSDEQLRKELQIANEQIDSLKRNNMEKQKEIDDLHRKIDNAREILKPYLKTDK